MHTSTHDELFTMKRPTDASFACMRAQSIGARARPLDPFPVIPAFPRPPRARRGRVPREAPWTWTWLAHGHPGRATTRRKSDRADLDAVLALSLRTDLRLLAPVLRHGGQPDVTFPRDRRARYSIPAYRWRAVPAKVSRGSSSLHALGSLARPPFVVRGMP